MKSLSIFEWLNDEKVAVLLTEDQIKKIKIDYNDIFEQDDMTVHIDDDYCNLPEIELTTGLPYAQKYFDDIMSFVTDDVESEKDYIYAHAVNIVKTQILCACQISFELPLWETKDFYEWENRINDVLVELDEVAKEHDDMFAFPSFFPYYSNEYVLYPRYMIRWISNVIEEFFYLAKKNMYDYSIDSYNEDGSEKNIKERLNELERERERRKDPQIKELEDLLCGRISKVSWDKH